MVGLLSTLSVFNTVKQHGIYAVNFYQDQPSYFLSSIVLIDLM